MAQILKGDINFLLFFININKMRYQITENEENLFFGKKCQGVSSDLIIHVCIFKKTSFNICYLFHRLNMTWIINIMLKMSTVKPVLSGP